MSVDSIIDHVEHGTSVEDTRNNFVFHNNEEFINFQKCFVEGVSPTYEPIFKKEDNSIYQYYPSNECDHISFTFMYNKGEAYQIINNRAFYLKGFKNIVLQGERSERSRKIDIPLLEVLNEFVENAGIV